MSERPDARRGSTASVMTASCRHVRAARAPAAAPSTEPRARRGRRRRLQHLAQHLVLRPEGLRAAVRHHQDQVDGGERARPVRDDDDDAAARAHAEDGAGQRLLALAVEIGVRLVEHDQERVAVERAGQRDALALAGRKRRAALADLGLVALRQAAGSARARRPPRAAAMHRRRVGAAARSGRCSRRRCRRTARRPAAGSRYARPSVAGGHWSSAAPSSRTLPAHRRPDADERAHQRRLARGAGADDAERPGRPRARSRRPATTTLLRARRRHGSAPSTREPCARRRQRHRRLLGRQPRQQLGQAAPALAGADEALPVGDRELDRRERARRQDRAGDDDAGRRLAAGSPDRRRRRARPTAAPCGGPCDSRAEAAGDVGDALLGATCIARWLAPQRGRSGRHAHRVQHLGVAAAGLGEARCAARRGRRLPASGRA